MSTNNLGAAAPIPLRKLVSGSLIVSGTAVGAGMLGLPLMTANAGLIGAYGITLAVCLFMMLTGFLFNEVILKMPRGSNILSISNRYLGPKASILTGIMFLFLYYCFLTAYFSGSSTLIQDVARQSFGLEISYFGAILLFAAGMGTILFFGAKLVDKSNTLLMAFLAICYFTMLTIGFSKPMTHVNFGMNLGPMMWAVPVLFGAFGYHNVLPSLSDYLNKDRRALNLSVIIGSAIAFFIYTLWQTLIITSVDPALMQECLKEGRSLISALASSTHSTLLMPTVAAFSFCAISTSVLGVGLSLVDFIKDGFHMRDIKAPRVLYILLAFIPPILLCFMDPAIFYKALGWAGGFGESYLNAILPIALVWVSRYFIQEPIEYESVGKKPALSALMVLAFCVMAIEIANSFFKG